MKEAKFIVGDIVKLNAGGPDMSITSIIDRFDESTGETMYRYNTTWFAGKKLERAAFNEEVLIPVVKKEDEK